MSGNNIVIYESVEGGGFNTLSADNTTFYVSNLYVNNAISFGNSSQNVVVNSTYVYINGTQLSGGLAAGTNNQIIFNRLGVDAGDTNLNWFWVNGTLGIGNSTVNSYINSTSFTGTVLSSNSAAFIGSVSAANVVSNAQLSANLTSFAANSVTFGNNVSVTNNLSVTANVTIGGSLSISGNLFIDGTLTSVNSSVIDTGDKLLILVNTATTNAQANGAGIIIGNSALILFDSGTGSIQMNVAHTPTTNNINLGAANSLWNVIANQISGTLTTVSQPNIIANNTSFVGSVSAANVVSNTQLSANLANYTSTAALPAFIAGNTANNATYFGGQLPAYYANVTAPVINTTLEVGAVSNNVTVNTTTINIGNSTVNASVNSTVYTGTALSANNATYFGGQLPAYYANVSTPVITTTLEVGSVTNNVTVNTTAINIGNSTVNASVNSTVYSGTSLSANNAAYFGGNPVGFYANVTTPNFSTTINVGSVSNSVVVNSTAISIGNSTVNNTINSTTYTGTAWNANSATNFGGLTSASYANTSAPVITTTLEVGVVSNNVTVNTTAINIGNSTVNGTINSSTLFLGNTSVNSVINSTTHVLANNGSNLLINSTSITIGNSTVNNTINSTFYNGSANNATNLNGLAASNYANTSTPVITTTLEVGASGNNVTLTTTQISIGNSSINNIQNSSSYFLTGTTATGNISINTASISIGNSVSNSTINSTVLYIRNATSNAWINASAMSVQGLIFANNAITGAAGQVLTSGGPYNNVYWSSMGAVGTTTQIAFNNGGSMVGDANLTWTTATATLAVSNTITVGSNVELTNSQLIIGNSTVNSVINSSSIALLGQFIANNNTVGTGGQVLTSGGVGGNVYWSTVSGGGGGGGPIGSTGQIAFNNAGTESGDANLIWTPTTAQLSIGNSTVNTAINTSSVSVQGQVLANNLTTGTAGQVLTSGGSTGNVYWTAAGGGGGPYGLTTQIAFNNAGTETGDANLTWTTASATLAVSNTITVGNSTVNATVNSTVYSGTSNNTSYLGGVIAASYANTTNTSATNITTGTLPWAQAPAGTVNTSGVFTLAGNTTFGANLTLSTAASQIVLQGGLGVGGNVIVNSTALFVGNSTANVLVNSTNFTGIANNALYLGAVIAASYANTTNTSATYITTGTLPWAQAPTGTVNTSGAFTIAGVHTHSANLLLNANVVLTGNLYVNGAIIANGGIGGSGQVLTSSAGGNVYWSTVSGGGPIGSTTQIAFNNAGTESGDANLTWTTGVTPHLTIGSSATANISVNATTISITSTTTVGNAAINASAFYVGNLVTSSIQNSTILQVGNSTANTWVNSSAFSLQGQVLANAATKGTAGQVLTSGGATGNVYWTTVSGGGAVGSTTQIAFNNAGTESGDANLTWTTLTSTLAVSNTITIGNSTVNSSVNGTTFSGTANNSSYLGGVIAASYANTTNTSATNITAGVLPWAQAPVGTVNTSGVFTLAGNTTFGANVLVSGLQLEVGAVANNITINTTALLIGNSTVFSTVNSTVYNQTANNASYLGTVAAANYANTTNTSATNITSGVLPWAQAPAGTVNTSGAFTISGIYTYSANVVFQSGVSANGGFGTSGQVLTSNGTTGSPYWSTVSGGTSLFDPMVTSLMLMGV